MKIIRKIFICSMFCIGILLSASVYAKAVKCTDKDFQTGAHGCKNTYMVQVGCRETKYVRWIDHEDMAPEEVSTYTYVENGREFTGYCTDLSYSEDSEFYKRAQAAGCQKIEDDCEGLMWEERKCTDLQLTSGVSGCKGTYEYTSSLIEDPGYSAGLVDSKIKNKIKNIWATISVIVQIISVGCVVFAGIRYMFSSADQRADIKKGLIYLTIGAIFVFGTTMVIQFIIDATNEIL